MAAATPNIGKIKDLQMAWRFAGPRERELVLFVLAAPAVAVAAFVAANLYLFLVRSFDGAVFIVNLIIIIPVASWSFFQPAITAPMYSNAYYREAIREGWLKPLQADWAAEIVRFREARGINGQISGNVERGRAYAIVYLAGVIGSVPFGLILYPILGGWSWAAFAIWYIPLVVVLWRLFWRRMRKEADAAEREGFRMREMAGRMRLELQRERMGPGKRP